MSKNVVNWFEIPVNDLGRAKNFYSELLKKKVEDMPMPGYEMAAFEYFQGEEHAAGALVKAEGYTPSHEGTLVYFTCNDVNDELGRVEKLGGKIFLPKTSIGEHGFIALFEDSEGNKIGLHSIK